MLPLIVTCKLFFSLIFQSFLEQLSIEHIPIYFILISVLFQIPVNDPYACTSFMGITPTTSKKHLVRAVLESIAFRYVDTPSQHGWSCSQYALLVLFVYIGASTLATVPTSSHYNQSHLVYVLFRIHSFSENYPDKCIMY